MEFESELTKWLLLCSRVLKAKEPVDAEIVEIWKGVLLSERVTVSELGFGFGKLLKSETFFPTPAEFLKTLERVRPSFAVIQDPVQVAPDMVASRRVAELEGLPILENEVLPALPTPEQRAESLSRLESKVVEKAKRRRVPVAELIAQDKSLPAPLSAREIEAKRELMRRQAGR